MARLSERSWNDYKREYLPFSTFFHDLNIFIKLKIIARLAEKAF